MPSKTQNLIFHWFHIFILIFKNLDSISNYIKIDVWNRYFHSKMHFLFVYMLHTIYLHSKFLLYRFLLYAITCYFGIIHFFQASSIKPDKSWVQSIKNNIKLIISFTCHCYFSHTSWVCYIKHRLTTNKQDYKPASWRTKTPTFVTIPEPSRSPFQPG